MKAEKAEPTSYKERSSLTTLILSRIFGGQVWFVFFAISVAPLGWFVFTELNQIPFNSSQAHCPGKGPYFFYWIRITPVTVFLVPLLECVCLCQLREMKSSGATSVFGSECRFENTVRIINVDKDIQNTGVTNWTACFLLLHLPGLNETMSFWFSAVLNFLWLKPMRGSKCSKNLLWISI